MSTPDPRPGDTLADLEVLMLITTADLAAPHGWPQPRRASFTWRTLNPYLVEIQLATRRGEDSASVWLLSRELLAEGLTHGGGQGDIRLHDPGSIWIRLTPPAGHLRVDARELAEFLRDTLSQVPLGQERMWTSMDAELATLLATP